MRRGKIDLIIRGLAAKIFRFFGSFVSTLQASLRISSKNCQGEKIMLSSEELSFRFVMNFDGLVQDFKCSSRQGVYKVTLRQHFHKASRRLEPGLINPCSLPNQQSNMCTSYYNHVKEEGLF